MADQKFFKCDICGNFVGTIHNSGAPMTCCGQEMKQLFPNTVEASTEKHIPKVEVKGRLVYVEIGSVLHPAEEAHHIEFIYLQTKNGGQRRSIKVGDKPVAMFAIVDDMPLEVYAYCNIHGLWKSDVMCECGSGEKMADCKCIEEETDCDCGHDHGKHTDK